MIKIWILISLLAIASVRCQMEEGEEEDLDDFIEELDEFVHAVQDQRESRDDQYNLTYFATAGRAEFLRWILAYANQTFIDTRIKADDWPKRKASTPFGQLPILEITRKDGKKYTLAQSKAIAIYLASRFGLEGETDFEEAFVNMYGEQLGDLFDAVNAAMLANTSQALFTSTWPNNFMFFEKRLIANGNGFLAGDSLSWADIFLSQITDFLYDKKTSFLANYPNVKALDARVRSMPSIAKWISTRPADN